MIAVSAPLQSLLGSNFAACAVLIEVAFSTGTQRMTTWPTDLIAGGQTWRGIGDVIKVPQTKSSADGSGETITLELSMANTGLLATLAGPSSVWRGRRVTMLAQFMDDRWQQVDTPRRFWAGQIRNISARAEPGADGITSAVISVEISRLGTGRARTAEGLRWTAAQHRQRWPDDAGLDGMASMLQKTTWLSEAFQKWQG